MVDSKIVLKTVAERDIDLLIIEEFISSKDFARIFLSPIGLRDDYLEVKALHSDSNANGESDITFVLRYPDKTVCLLIEDKIDAPTMLDQSYRYYIRGNDAVARCEYDCFYTVLVSPRIYYEEHKNDANAQYDSYVHYESLLEFFKNMNDSRMQYKKALLETALFKQKAGYRVNENIAVSRFWTELRTFCTTHPTNLAMKGKVNIKGSKAVWPEFDTSLKNVKVVYKSDMGYVDLQFPGYGDRVGSLYQLLGGKLNSDMKIWRTGKSASVRLSSEAWITDFTKDFEDEKETIEKVLFAASRLCDLANSINYVDLYAIDSK